MIRLITASEMGENYSTIVAMHQLRYRVFKKRLNWEVSTSGEMEVDVFDTMRPIYLIHENAAGRVDGCVRLLPTIGPYMLREVFPILLGDAAAPVSSRIWEASRFAIDHDGSHHRTRSGLSVATFELLSALIEFGLAWNLTDMVAVVDRRFDRILLKSGWPLRRLGEEHRIGNDDARAGLLEISAEALDKVRERWGSDRPVLPDPYQKVA